MSFGQLTNQIVIMFCLMLVGVLINKLGFMKPQTSTDLTNILLYFVSPCLIIGAFQQQYSPNRMKMLLLVAAGIGIFYIVSILLAKLLFGRMADANLRRIAQYGSIYSNAGFMGVPLISALFGSNGVFFAVAFLAGFNIFSWTHGISLFTPKKAGHPLDNLKEIVLNPNIIAIVVGLVIFMTSFKLPSIPNQIVHYVASINTPLSMIVIGNSLADIKLTKQLVDKHLWLALIARNLLFPLAAILALHLLGVTGVALYTTVIMAACPVAGVVVLFTLKIHGDASPAVALMSLSTILSLVTIPLVFAVTNFL
ncbi:auxin efflux carrier [Agrilactobacillus composti DSM 18527 = JCM 14202]|uniref:Auxin efflux carrier n=1 Tax=Agrilactobacillus composti DSM 18527 = JCM 14202 TaxID=1423734 RepID=X0PWE9_9LACO|nr:AEC family transporter [Agrilactobacillus composti]KRM33510.1 auxin efflux carrier [Agrilactobacillus composti DSM 18527 = JCM 14202]GAF41896.1 malate permease [Agrilactobacillus composti DSM 18527 = JCM 14202]